MAPIKTNNPYASYFDFFSRTGTDAVNPSPVPAPGLTATGGIISDYESSGTYYRAHVFTSSGRFDVTDLGSISSTVEYLVVAGGGGGGARGGGNAGGGGGAGGLRTNLTGHPLAGSTFTVSTSPGQYTVTVGGGGQGANDANGVGVSNGGDSAFGPITSHGGGHGGGHHTSPTPASFAQNGGSGGGGGGATPYAGGSGNTPSQSPPQGNPGGPGYNGDPYVGGGGGGAGGVGFSRNPSAPNPGSANGGAGSEVLIAEPPATPAPQRTIGDGGYFAGGGGGGSFPSPDGKGTGGTGGGGNGGNSNPPSPVSATSGDASTGGGGGGGGSDQPGAPGGSGIVVIRYEIQASQSDVAKASGGAISYYNGKTIHAFTSSGTFTAPATFNETVEYVVVGGGGAGGGPSAPGVNSYYGGGGGAGAYRKGSTPISTPQSIAIQVGAGGAKGVLIPAAGSPSYFGTPITSPGGGYGATWQDPGGQPTVGGGPGASSGGSSYGGSVASNTGTSFTASPKDATADTPTNGWGHGGGAGYPSGDNGGGGGAGGAGQAAVDSAAGDGGLGMQLPTTFRDPAQSFGAPGPTNTSTHNPGWTNIDNSGKYWVAGGGGGGSYGPDSGHTSGVGGVGTPTGGTSPFAGAGNGSRFFAGGTAALQNTGSGGGGMERAPGAPAPQPDAGNGGSGLVLIAYPT